MTVVVSDTFTDTDGTLLSDHTPDTDTVGNGWVDDDFLGTANSGSAEIQSNQAAPVGISGRLSYIDSGESDCDVSTDWTPQDSRSDLVVRWSGTNNQWDFNLRQPNGDWRIRKTATGTTTIEDSGSQTFTKGTAYALKAALSGSSLEFQIDGVSKSTLTDSFNSTATKHGIGCSSTDGLERFDNFTVETAGGSTVSGSVSETEADDTVSASGLLVPSGTVSVTEAADTLSANGVLRLSGSLSETEANDTLSASGALVLSGSVSETEDDDTLSATGTFTEAQNVTGTLSETETNDTASISGYMTPSGSLAVTEDSDILNASGTGGEIAERLRSMVRSIVRSIVKPIITAT